ncbi:glycoside hydrolase family 6 protein [Streptomyces aureoverticillatus]|uniref:glycoside hydrolase family 6 protein n=1 Tax=Streptomyces aureoverticillatus TaxID=66871 RepID=UPI0013DCBB5B|nr:glycoside hydrolase family 6 protein [Streptomyces aureoverticillatus]QIB43515.1 glycoside hydrolase family 6 protein [Streptomyces aureoverticillatus]
MHRLLRTFTALTAAAALGLTAGCSSGSGSGPGKDEREKKGEAAAASPKAAAAPHRFWVDPQSEAARQVRQWQEEGRTQDAEALKSIADQPMAVWPAGDDPAPDIEKATAGAADEGRTAVLVAYNIPHRDCGQHSAGGAHDAAYYRQWLGTFADAIGNNKALVILEPDAIPHIVDGCTPAQYHEERYELLSEAIERLKRQPNVKVYLDAGNPGWIDVASKLTLPLRRAGVERADGFSLNVSNFQGDGTVKAYGRQLSATVGGKHFVMDSSRNGKGPLAGDRQDAWCNPPGRGLGTPPTDRTGDPLLDAYLWIKRPGDSDGPCRGGPAAGQWWPDYALGLVRNAKA